jgi:hypothetical protein
VEADAVRLRIEQMESMYAVRWKARLALVKAGYKGLKFYEDQRAILQTH